MSGVLETNQSGQRLLTSDEAAVKLGISTATLLKIRRKGAYDSSPPPYLEINVGKRKYIRYNEDELDKWIMALPRYHSTAELKAKRLL